MVGPITSHASELTNLTRLYLNGNLLNGTSPLWLYNLPSFTYLDLNNNQGTGHIKSFLHKKLLTLGMSKNKLQLPVPSSMFKCSNLTQVDLSSNNLSGILYFNTVSSSKNLCTLIFAATVYQWLPKSMYPLPCPDSSFWYCILCNISEFFLGTLEDIQE